MLTPSYAAYLVEWAAERGFDLRGSSVERVLVAGEPGGGEPAFRAKLEEGWGARVTEAMGIGDIGSSLWGECEEQDGMHLGARGFVHAELIDPETGARRRAGGRCRRASSCSRTFSTAPRRSCASARATTSRCGRARAVRPHRPARALHRAHRRHADRARRQRLPLGRARGRERLRARGQRPHPRQAAGAGREAGAAAPRQRSSSRADAPPDAALAEEIRERLRDVLVVQTEVELVPCGSLQRSEYKSKLVDHRRVRPLDAEAPEPGRAPHHARRRRPADVDRLLGGLLGMPFVFEQPNLDNEAREPPLLRPGRRAPDHRLHERGA